MFPTLIVVYLRLQRLTKNSTTVCGQGRGYLFCITFFFLFKIPTKCPSALARLSVSNDFSRRPGTTISPQDSLFSSPRQSFQQSRKVSDTRTKLSEKSSRGLWTHWSKIAA